MLANYALQELGEAIVTARIERQGTSALQRFESGRQLDALFSAMEAGQELNAMDKQSLSYYSVHFSPDGERLATASDDNTVRVWNKQGQLVTIL